MSARVEGAGVLGGAPVMADPIRHGTRAETRQVGAVGQCLMAHGACPLVRWNGVPLVPIPPASSNAPATAVLTSGLMTDMMRHITNCYQ
jgi:hypothetical protein